MKQQPVAGVDFDPDRPMEGDDYEWFSGTGRYEGDGWTEWKERGETTMEIQQGEWKIEQVVVPMDDAWQLADGTWLKTGGIVFRVLRNQGQGWYALNVHRTARDAAEYVDAMIEGGHQPFDLANLLDQ